MIFSNKKPTVLFNMVGFFAKIDKIVSMVIYKLLYNINIIK